MMQPMVQCLRALGDENRVRILMLLRERDLCVLELMGALGISQPLVSSHLAVLRTAGLVASRKEGRRVRYGLSPEARRGGKHGLIRIVAAAVAEEPAIAADRERLAACSAFRRERGACDRTTLAAFRGRKGRTS
jgi:ArsR family transcriptional regulator